ncbi:hypothetical protein GCM10027597_30130 [Saccharopolyspora tripterygii]
MLSPFGVRQHPGSGGGVKWGQRGSLPRRPGPGVPPGTPGLRARHGREGEIQEVA